MRPAQPDLLEGDQALARPTTARPRGRRAGAVGPVAEPATPLGLAPATRRPRAPPAPRPMRAGRLAGEDLELGGAVGGERPVAVEVVLGEVEQHAGVGREALGVLELERGRLADDRRALRQPACRRAWRAPSRRCPPPPPAWPAARCRWPISSTVVVLPLEPVTAIVSFGTSRQPISSSPTTASPASRAAATTGACAGTPGLLTTVPAAASSSSPTCRRGPPRPPPRAPRGARATTATGVAARPPPRRAPRSASATATPERARPTTR